ncbi:acyl-CoA-binding protein [Nocardia terpenica]|uniref:Acyl-CoA-binding protein n=1 Tax=Nocardia terpenica TaxID=455432 RepID=A0A6G9YV18_9NOCA|nr:acyl-CoA-binding protein [Nocardia terpenica]QIS16951.1 acyl-CoA-binding protein [Nocardia terpenica]
MSDLDTRFAKARKDVQQLSMPLSASSRLELYALFRQATEGDIRSNPPRFNDIIGWHRYDARERLKGMAKHDAKEQYIELVNRLKNAETW